MGEGVGDGMRVRKDVEVEHRPSYTLQVNPEFLDFTALKVTSQDEAKSWKPALTVEVTKADGSVVRDLDANIPFFTFKDSQGKEIIVTAATAGHIYHLHIQGEDLGSHFNEPSLQALFADLAAHMPAGLADREGIFTFDIAMDKNMGKEGIASMDELVRDGILTPDDVAAARAYKSEVQALNKGGDKEAMRAFVDQFAEDNPHAKVTFALIRDGEAIVPQVRAAKRVTQKLFVMMGPDTSGEKRNLYTIAPGRDMPRHPIAGQHVSREGVVDEASFQQSANAWFDTVMLVG